MKVRNPEPPWRLLDHTADIRLEICGSDLSALFLNAAEGLTEILGIRPDPADPEEIELRLEAEGLEELLVQWLKEILFFHQTRDLVFLRSAIEDLSDKTLFARVSFARKKAGDEPEMEIKAVTYHDLSIERDERGFCAKVVFDI